MPRGPAPSMVRRGVPGSLVGKRDRPMPNTETPGDVRPPRAARRPWARSQRPVPRTLVQPLERFLGQEAGSGGLLLAAALIALIWVNVAGDSYNDLWSQR